MTTKKLTAMGGILVLGGIILSGTVRAADTTTVTATVTVQNISVTVADGAISYGTIAVNTSKNTTAADLNDLQTSTNNGNVAEDINIKGQNSAPGNWVLAGTAGVDQYVHQFSVDSGNNWTSLTTNYQTLGAGVAANGTQTFDLKITTPTSVTDFTQQTVDVTVQATAA